MKMSQNEAVSWNFWGIIRFSINIILKIVGHSRWNCFSNLVFVSHIARKAGYRMPKYLPKSNQNHHGITIKMQMSPCLKRRWEFVRCPPCAPRGPGGRRGLGANPRSGCASRRSQEPASAQSPWNEGQRNGPWDLAVSKNVWIRRFYNLQFVWSQHFFLSVSLWHLNHCRNNVHKEMHI